MPSVVPPPLPMKTKTMAKKQVIIYNILMRGVPFDSHSILYKHKLCNALRSLDDFAPALQQGRNYISYCKQRYWRT